MNMERNDSIKEGTIDASKVDIINLSYKEINGLSEINKKLEHEVESLSYRIALHERELFQMNKKLEDQAVNLNNLIDLLERKMRG